MANILIIGATSAIAAAMAKAFAARGDKLFLVARNKRALDQLNQQLGDSVLGYSSGDFNHASVAESAVIQALQTMKKIDVALLAHGYIGEQQLSESDSEHARLIIDTNFTSMIGFLVPISRLMEKQGAGKIAVMASVAGDRGRPRNYTYGSAKAGLAAYLQGLRSVMWGKGVEVYTFKLGPVITPMTTEHKKNFSFSSIDNVVELMLKRLESKRYQCYVPPFWYWVMLAVRNMPEFIFQRIGFLSGR